MRKVLASFVMACLLAVSSVLSAADYTDLIKTVEKSIVYLEADGGGSCTGFVIDQKRRYVMTAAHCTPEDGNSMIWVDRVTSRIVSKDTKKDLLVLEVKDLDPTRPAMKLAPANPERGQDVLSAGFGMALERPVFRQAHVQDDAMVIPNIEGNPYIALDTPFIGGQSGGPVVNHAGFVVMIVQRGNGTTGIGVGATVIRERMGRFFAPE